MKNNTRMMAPQSCWILTKVYGYTYMKLYIMFTQQMRAFLLYVFCLFPPFFLSPGCATLARNAAWFALQDYAALTSTEEVLGQWNMEVQGLPASLNSNTWD